MCDGLSFERRLMSQTCQAATAPIPIIQCYRIYQDPGIFALRRWPWSLL